MNQDDNQEFIMEQILTRNKSEILAMISKLSDRASADCAVIEAVKDLNNWRHSISDFMWMIDVINCLLRCMLGTPVECQCDETVWLWLNAEDCELDDFFEM